MTESVDLFPTTRPSVIGMSAANHDRFLEGFAELFRIYRQPIYRCIRRNGHSHEDAEDLVQAYFGDLQRRDYVASFDRNRGKFRAFIQTDLKFFLNNQRRKAKALPPAGGNPDIQADAPSPELAIDRDWAMATLSEAIAIACRECGKTESRIALFQALAPLLDKAPTAGQYDELAARFGKTPQSLAVDMSRLRKSFGRALEHLVRSTQHPASPEETRTEIQYLFQSLHGGG